MFAAIKMVLTWLLWLFIPLVFLYSGWEARGISDQAKLAAPLAEELKSIRTASRELLAATRTATEQSQATIRDSRSAQRAVLATLEAAGLGDGVCDIPPDQRVRGVENRETYNIASGLAEDGSDSGND